MTQVQPSRRVLLISHDVIGRKMAGPGIRYYHLARVLARHFDLTLAVPRQPDRAHAEKTVDLAWPVGNVVPYVNEDWSTIERHVAGADVLILPSDIAWHFPQLAACDRPIVIDGYDPLLIEWLALHGRDEAQAGGLNWRRRMQALHHQYSLGDFYICASDRQRDWWLGLLEAHGRINPWTFSADPSLRSLIDVVPYGLPQEQPRTTRPVIKGVWPGIGADDRVILWGGGLWLWLDPLTAIRAVAQVWQQRQDVRLIFPGTRHPNPILANIGSHNEAAKRLAAELGLLDRAVFFGDWIPYEDWGNVLLESDVAVSLHFDTIETRLAFRSRIMEYIWAGLPSVVTRGDATSDLIRDYDLGVVVEYGDVDGVAQALVRLLETHGERSAAFQRARCALTWDKLAAPLIDFCRQPARAPDRIALNGQIGNPAWLQQRQDLVAEIERLEQRSAHLATEVVRQATLIQGYEQGRFMRTMRWLHRWKQGVQRRVQRKG